MTKKPLPIRILAATLFMGLALAACSDDDPEGGLLAGNDSTADTEELTDLTGAVLELSGPANAAPGQETTGYLARLTTSDGTAIEQQFVAITAVEGGSIAAPPNQPATNGANTDAFGRVRFSFTPPEDITEATTVNIRGTATDDNNLEIEDTLQVTVRPDVFQFTAPNPNTPIQVGSANAEPVSFQWTRDSQTGGGGVSGEIRLTIDNNARIVVNDDPQNARQQVTIQTSATSGGNFRVPVSIFNNTSGFSTLTARDNAATTRTATVNVQFVDQAGTSDRTRNLTAAPLVVEPAPSTSRFSQLEFEVLNDAFEPVTGIDVTFELLVRAGGGNNERVFPGGGTTDAQGRASAQYEAGVTEGTATVRACVRDTSNCDSRDITVAEPTP